MVVAGFGFRADLRFDTRWRAAVFRAGFAFTFVFVFARRGVTFARGFRVTRDVRVLRAGIWFSG